MSLTMHAERGHAEIPSNDGWAHYTQTDNARLTLTGPADEISAIVRELRDRGRIGDGVLSTFHDGPGEQSCGACRPAPADPANA